MPNPFNSEVGQQNKTGGVGVKPKAAGSKAGFKTQTRNRAVPGKTGPKRDTMGVRHVQQYPGKTGL